MRQLLNNIQIQIPEKLFLKDPESSALGRKIVSRSIVLIDNLGFEAFTFKKLGEEIGSPESTVYRYFENKHALLLYLTSWYWGWLEYKIVFATANVDEATQRLCKALRTLTETSRPDQKFSHVDESTLQRIVMAESTKAFLTKAVDSENKEGYFANYQRLSQRIAQIILDAKPGFTYAHSLTSLILEGTHLQKFFGQHLPGFTDTRDDDEALYRFFEKMTLNTLEL